LRIFIQFLLPEHLCHDLLKAAATRFHTNSFRASFTIYH
jgi:hypothetical protein